MFVLYVDIRLARSAILSCFLYHSSQNSSPFDHQRSYPDWFIHCKQHATQSEALFLVLYVDCLVNKSLRITGFLDFSHRPVFWKIENTTFQKLDPFRLQTRGKTPTQLGPSLYQWLRLYLSKGHLLTPVLRSRIFLPWRYRRYVHPKRRFTEDLHGAIS
jgi:hypothetical protein